MRQPNHSRRASRPSSPNAWTARRLAIERHRVGAFAMRYLPASAPRKARPPIVWIHGLGESGRCFEAVIARPELAGWTHFVPDLVGYGRSAWVLGAETERAPSRAASPESSDVTEPRGLEGHTSDVLAWLGRLRATGWIDGPVTLAGHSMGGVIGTLMVERLLKGLSEHDDSEHDDSERGAAIADRIAGFFDIEGNLTLDDCTSSAYTAEQTLEHWLAEGYDAHFEHLEALAGEPSDPTREARDVLRGYAASVHFADPRAFWRDSRELVELSRPGNLARRLGEALDAIESLEGYRLPTVYFYGRTRGTGERSLASLRDARIDSHGFEPAGHWPYLDQPAAFATAMAERLLDWSASR